MKREAHIVVIKHAFSFSRAGDLMMSAFFFKNWLLQSLGVDSKIGEDCDCHFIGSRFCFTSLMGRLK